MDWRRVTMSRSWWVWSVAVGMSVVGVVVVVAVMGTRAAWERWVMRVSRSVGVVAVMGAGAAWEGWVMRVSRSVGVVVGMRRVPPSVDRRERVVVWVVVARAAWMRRSLRRAMMVGSRWGLAWSGCGGMWRAR